MQLQDQPATRFAYGEVKSSTKALYRIHNGISYDLTINTVPGMQYLYTLRYAKSLKIAYRLAYTCYIVVLLRTHTQIVYSYGLYKIYPFVCGKKLFYYKVFIYLYIKIYTGNVFHVFLKKL